MENNWNGRDDEAPKHEQPAPWDEPPEDDPAPARPARHDAFTPARHRVFLKHLVKTGCIADAARLTGVAARTIYRHQEADEGFARNVELAIRMAGGGVEQTAWERGVLGVDEQFACGGKVYTRKRYSDSLLRLLLQGSNPDKYGSRPGFTRKRMRKWEREEIRREIHRENLAKQPSIEQVKRTIIERANNIRRQREQRQFAEGWSRSEDGDMIPPGWVRDPAWNPPADPPESHETPRDSV